MFPNEMLLEGCQIQPGFSPGTLGSALTAIGVSLNGYTRCLILFHKSIGTADPPTLTLMQGTDLTFGTETLLPFRNVYVKQDPTTLANVGQWTKLEQALSNAFSDDDATLESLWAIDIGTEDMNAEAGMNCIRAVLSGDSGGGQIGSLMYIAYAPVNATAPENMAPIVA